MPTIAYFYGIAIRMFFNDRPPPHVFVSYGGHEANVAIATGDVIDGAFARQRSAAGQRVDSGHRRELDDNWERARRREPLIRVAGLDE